MNILHVVGDSKFGGGSVIIAQLVIDQHQEGHNVAVLTTDKEFDAYLSGHGIKVVNLDCIWRSYNLFADSYGVFKLAKFLKNNQYDVVHTHTTKAGFVGRVAAWLAKTKVIVHTVHGFPFSEVSSKTKVRVFSILEKLLFKISTKVVFVSNYHLQWAKELRIISTRAENAIAIRNGVEPVGIRDKICVPDTFPRLVFIGRMVKEKGIFDLLAAYTNLREKYKNLSLVFIGDGPDFDALKQEAQKDINITLTGFVSDVPSMIDKDDIFVLPSYREGLSISAIEAQSMGLASVLSNVGGNVEASDNGDAALLFRIGDVVDLSRKLEYLISDTAAREKLKGAALMNFEKHFTSARMLAEYRNMYSMFDVV